MRTFLTLGHCLVLLVFLSECSSVKNQGTDALTELIRILNGDQLSPRQIEFVNENFDKVRIKLNSEAQAELESTSRFKWQNALADFEKLQTLNGLLVKHQNLFSEVAPRDYSAQIEQSKAGLMEDLYGQAEEALSANNREGAKVAYFQLSEISGLSKGFKDTEDLRAEALEMATIPVLLAIDSTQIPPLGSRELRESLRPFVDTDGVSGPFIQFHFYDQWDDLNRVTHIAMIRIDDIQQGKMIVKDYVQEVEGEVEEYKIEEYSQHLNLAFSIEITETGLGQVLKKQEFELSHPYSKSIGSFTGDPTLLNEYQKSIFAREITAPTESELFLEAVPFVRNELVSFLLDFYQGY